MPRKLFAAMERASTATCGQVVSLSARVTRADGTDEGERVVAFQHPDNRITRLWRTSRERLGLPAGKITNPPKGTP